MIKKNAIEGTGNILVGGDLVLRLSQEEETGLLQQLFSAADRRFKQEISATGKIFRISEEINYSAEALFTSLMQLGLPADVALKLPSEIIGVLRDILDSREGQDQDLAVTTADIRVAVVRALEGLPSLGRFSVETTHMWAAAYIRRYGNPESDFVKVIDHDEERDLNYEYIGGVLLPHILGRVLGLPRDSAPEKLFSQVFTKSRIAEMSTEIMRSVNTLNLYSIGYRTILFLTQDLVLEPPHPWLVTDATKAKVVEYNIERMSAHYSSIRSAASRKNIAILQHAHQEFFRHSCAALLAMYGAFLGVGTRYGLVEMIRILNMRKNNQPLWSTCDIRSIEVDLNVLGISISKLSSEAERARSKMSNPAINGKHLADLETTVEFLFELAVNLRRAKFSTRWAVSSLKCNTGDVL